MFLGIYTRWRGDYERVESILSATLPELKETSVTTRHLLSLFMYGLTLGEQGRYQEAMEVLCDGRDFPGIAGC